MLQTTLIFGFALVSVGEPDSDQVTLPKQTDFQSRVVVAGSGKIENCGVTRSTGYRTLDNAACNALKKHFRFIEVMPYSASKKSVEYVDMTFSMGTLDLDAPFSWDAKVIIRKRTEFKWGDDSLPRDGKILPWERI